MTRHSDESPDRPVPPPQSAVLIAVAGCMFLVLLFGAFVVHRVGRLDQRIASLEAQIASVQKVSEPPVQTVPPTSKPGSSAPPPSPDVAPAPATLPDPKSPPADTRQTPDCLAKFREALAAYTRGPASLHRQALLESLQELDEARDAGSIELGAGAAAALEGAIALRDTDSLPDRLSRYLENATSPDMKIVAAALGHVVRGGDPAKAGAAVEAAIQRIGRTPDLLLFEAQRLSQTGRRMEAHQLLVDCMETLQPQLSEGLTSLLGVPSDDVRFRMSRRLLAMLLPSAGQGQEALRVWREVLTEDASDSHGWDALGVLLIGQQRDEEAREVFRQALQSQPPPPGAHFHLAVAEANLGNTAAALKEFDEAIRLGENRAVARFGRAVCLMALNRESEAEEELSRALALDSKLSDLAIAVPAFGTLLENPE